MSKIREIIHSIASKLDWFPGLVSRLTIGGIFIQTGWGKITHLDKVINFFTSLGIPAPRLQAPFVASVELGCGTLVLLGLFTRVASVPLIGTMIVAIITVKIKEVQDYSDFLSLPEYLFIVLLLWLIVKGAGSFSVDRLLAARCEKKS